MMSSNFNNSAHSASSDEDHKVHPNQPIGGGDGFAEKSSFDVERGAPTLPMVGQYNDDGTPVQLGIANVEAAQAVWSVKTKWALYVGYVDLASRLPCISLNTF